MNKFILYAMLIMVVSCNNLKLPKKQANPLIEGYYMGFAPFEKNYLFIKNDCIIVDQIHVEKFPRSLISDTLFFNSRDNNWTGKLFSFYYYKNHFHLRNLKYTTHKNRFRIKLRNDEVYYKENINSDKNYGVWREYYISQIRSNPKEEMLRVKKFTALIDRYSLYNKIGGYSHQDFLLLFEKIKLEFNF